MSVRMMILFSLVAVILFVLPAFAALGLAYVTWGIYRDFKQEVDCG